MNMNHRTIPAGTAAALAVLLCGCHLLNSQSPVELRIAQRAAAYMELTAEQQGRVRLGHIQLGDTTNMLWMVFGDPAETATRATPLVAQAEGLDPAEVEAAGERELETWTYVREPAPWESGPRPPSPAYQPGALFVDAPPPPPVRSIKTYVFENGVIVDMGARNETPAKSP